MAKGVTRVPVTVKIRLGWNDEMRNHVELARAAVDGGAQAVFVHGRTRDARYRRAADWEAIGEVAAAVSRACRRQRRSAVPARGRDPARARRMRGRDGRSRRAHQAVDFS
jgi:hypothetical protein